MKKTNKFLLTISSLLTATIFNLSACVPVIILGAAAGGLVVYDQRDFKTMQTDENIRFQINRELGRDQSFSEAHIVVASFNHVVLLAGQTPVASLRVKAEAIAKEQRGVSKVYNEITIENPTADMVRASDSWITAKIKSEMLATKNLQSGAIKIVTENGVVFLMGEVTRDQANIAISIARKIKGVQKVVNAFGIVSY